MELSTGQHQANKRATLPTIVLLIAVSVALARLAKLWSSAKFGIDFTDEGYYLVWISNPFAYRDSITQFGFFYHPLYEWLGGDVVRLRQANILITFVLAWGLGTSFFRSAFAGTWPPGSWRSRHVLAIAGILAISYPHVFGMWLPTPSYNSLALQAVLLAGSGLLLMDKSISKATSAGAVFVGISGWMAFMAKPTTAGALAAVALVYLLLSGKFNWRLVGLAGLVASLLLAGTVWAMDGSIPAFIERLNGALEIAKLMGDQHTLSHSFRVDGFSLEGGEIVVGALLIIALAWCTVSSGDAPTTWQTAATLLVLAGALSSVALIGGLVTFDIRYGRFRGLLILALPIAAVATAFVIRCTHEGGSFSRRNLALAMAFAVIPHAFAFGTGNNYWQAAQSAGIFWIFAGLAILVPAMTTRMSWRCLLPTAVGSQLIAVALLQIALAHPYRQPTAVGADVQWEQVGANETEIFLGRDYANYVRKLRSSATEAGFRAHTPVIDLTGHSPGSLYSMGARSTGQPWILGGYPGSDKSAASILSHVGCEEMAAAWLLVEPDGPTSLSASVLRRSGVKWDRDFILVGKFLTPAGFGGYAVGNEQILLKPSRPPADALQACTLARKSPE